MKYYKCVRNYNGKLISASVSKNETYRKQIEYKVGEWIEAPDNTRLFVFDNLDSAINFSGLSRYIVIYECKVIGVTKGYPCTWLPLINDFWSNFLSCKKKKQKINWNTYTVDTTLPSILAKKVKLIKKVNKYKKEVVS